MKFLFLLLIGLPAFATETFEDGATRIAFEFAGSRELKAQLRRPLDDRPVHEYFGVASATFHMNAPWFEMREDVENYYRKYSKDARIAWFEPRQSPDGHGRVKVYFPYVVKTDLPSSLIPSDAKPLKELLILAIVRVDMPGSKWQIATEVADHDLIYWNQMLGEVKANSIQGYKTGAIMIARYGDSAPAEGGWRLVEAYEFGKPSPSRPHFSVLREKPEVPVQTAKILRFPGCAKAVTK